MRLGFDDSVEAFRSEFLEWLAANRPPAEEMEADPQQSSAHVPDWAKSFARRMFDDGWLVPGWPPERGGRNAGPIETLVYLEELSYADIPRTTNPQGLGIIAPSILDFGTEDQIQRYAMPLLRGEVSACLGMSEPDAGSDLANLKTRAVRDGDNYVINGQKVWTSGADYADFCFLFCRTNPDAPKHKGISIILMPMDTPGVTVRPLKEIVSPQNPDLAEVFLDDVVLPAENLVGEENNGWAMANGSLAHERSMVWLMGVLGMDAGMTELLGVARDRLSGLPLVERTLAADEIAGLYVDTVAARCLGYRGFARFVKTGSAPEQALMKAYSTEGRREILRVAAELFGPDSMRTGPSRHGGLGSLDAYFSSFGSTISAGSSEIQRNIIAERVLGLPRG